MAKKINLEQDAYGQEVWAYYNKRESFEIIERDDYPKHTFWISSGPKSYFSDLKDWTEIEKKAMYFVKGKVLDVGCGAGRLCLYLQKKKFDVAGIDNSPLAIKVCKLRGVKTARNIGIEDVDKLKTKFDSIVMFGNNFGLFGGYEKGKNILKKMHNITSDDGRIIAETTDPRKTKDPLVIAYHKYNLKRGRMAGQIKIRVLFKQYVGEWFDYLLASKNEIKEIVNGTGWKVEKFINARKSPKYMVILKKE